MLLVGEGNQYEIRNRCWVSLVGTLLLVYLWLWPVKLSAEIKEALNASEVRTIGVILSGEADVYQSFYEALYERLQEPTTADVQLDIRQYGLPLSKKNYKALEVNSDLIVTVGNAAAADVVKHGLSIPTLYTLLPKATYEVISQEIHSSQKSSIYLDQPLARSLALLRLALPEHRELAVLLGPSSGKMKTTLKKEVKGQGFFIAIANAENNNIINKLDKISASERVLLAVPDSQIFNRRTAPHILLSAYKQRMPVLGYSEAYVKAGALMAVYSSPRQLALHTADMISGSFTRDELILPSPQYSKYFSVAVNQRVGRSLGLRIPDEKLLLQKLKKEVIEVHE